MTHLLTHGRHLKRSLNPNYQPQHPLIPSLLHHSARPAGALTHLPVAYNTALAPPGADPFPVIVFSPGAAACRNTYSSVCTELASRGCVVAAVEHADGSSVGRRAFLLGATWRIPAHML